ncbi:MAG: DUF4239 domain-containing protein [Candidatus Eremiobacteraeota bacterium]|nr:DUF4239 domain-containing protein [Candidatus Eremiobacteraeota bacterium]
MRRRTGEGRRVLWVYNFPTWVFTCLTVTAMCSIACLGHLLARRYLPIGDLVKGNSVAGFIIGIIGTAYAVLLSFMVVVVWQQFDGSDGNTAVEAGAASDLHHLCDSFPRPLGTRMKSELDEYVSLMIGAEWPAMQKGGWSPRAQGLSRLIERQVADFAPKTSGQSNLQAQALAEVRTLLDARRRRLHDNETGIPRILWWTLWAVACVTIGFSYFFGLENVRIQMIMTAALTSTIALIFVLIAELDYPFRGQTSISPHSWYQVQRQLHSDH